MTLGVPVLDWTPQPDKYKNDNIHPCVRYIEQGFAGHKWWMVTTPYYNSDSTIENPILYYGDSPTGTNLPPTSWQGGAVVEDTPASGYNSDACIYFDGTKLWVFWRENGTPDCTSKNTARATFGRSTTNGSTFSNKKLFAPLGFDMQGKQGDAEMCPIVVNFDGHLRLYGTHYEFTPSRKPYGLAIWDIENNDLETKQFTLTKTVGQQYRKGFNFWHYDLFKHESKYYCVVTPESGAEILIGVSDDCENFKFWSTPLLSNSVSGTQYLYKPTAMVHDGIFYVWHPNRVNGINKIYMSQILFTELLERLESTVSRISKNIY